MVTLKVRSAEDIIRAYLKALGWKKDFDNAVAVVLSNDIALDRDILAEIDKIIFKKAFEVFGKKEKHLDNEQLTASFKYCFLACGGAKKWKEIIFEDKPFPQEFVDKMLEVYPNIVPRAKLCRMNPQNIESYSFASMIKRLFKKSGK